MDLKDKTYEELKDIWIEIAGMLDKRENEKTNKKCLDLVNRCFRSKDSDLFFRVEGLGKTSYVYCTELSFSSNGKYFDISLEFSMYYNSLLTDPYIEISKEDFQKQIERLKVVVNNLK